MSGPRELTQFLEQMLVEHAHKPLSALSYDILKALITVMKAYLHREQQEQRDLAKTGVVPEGKRNVPRVPFGGESRLQRNEKILPEDLIPPLSTLKGPGLF